MQPYRGELAAAPSHNPHTHTAVNMSAADLAAAKALLQKKVNGNSVYDHLADVLLKVISENPDDAVEVFEAISASVKRSRFNVSKDTAAGVGVPESKADPDVAAAQAAWAASTEKLFKAPEPAEGVDEPAPVQDLADEANYLEWAGVSLGREEAFRLSLALKHLAASVPVSGLRFWGKILGTGGDYIVAEGVLAGEEGEEARDSNGVLLENPGEGANKFTYFVCSYAGGEWTKLPNVSPEQIVVARSIRRFFTGNLDAAVGGHPPFPGTERHYLRAQIARISAATVLAPSGYYVAGEDEEQFNIAVNEEVRFRRCLCRLRLCGWLLTCRCLRRLCLLLLHGVFVVVPCRAGVRGARAERGRQLGAFQPGGEHPGPLPPTAARHQRGRRGGGGP